MRFIQPFGQQLRRSIVRSILTGCASALMAGGVASAQETTTYRYDALGRLTSATVSTGPATGIGAVYEYDAVGNRTRVRVGGAQAGASGASSANPAVQPSAPAGAPGTSGSVTMVIVPLNGLTSIPSPTT